MSEQKRLGNLLSGVMFAATVVTTYLICKEFVAPYMSRVIDPDRDKREQAKLRAQEKIQRLRDRQMNGEGYAGKDELGHHPGKHGQIEDLVLDEYENMVALEVVAPEEIPTGFSAIGGLEDIIEELRESIIYPLTMPHLYSHGGALLSAPSGVLLYGPPGCGKTMLAKAVARESGASFINLHISTITEKWYGDSNKLVRAVFSLARKLQPSIIFIDEIDAVLGTRRSGEHEASGQVKAEFMTLWDGLTSTNAAGIPARIVVLGATNRINDIDEAILRRMPKKFPVPLPDLQQRRRILEIVLTGTKRDPENFDLDYIAKVTAGLSGSDLKEACRDAAMAPMREYIREHRASGKAMSRVDPQQVRGIRTSDFFGHRGGRMFVHEREPVSSATSSDVQAQVEELEDTESLS